LTAVVAARLPHTLEEEHAREAAENLAKDLAEQFEVNYQWDGDLLRFKRSGVKGQLEISHADLHIHLELGMMLRPFKSRIEQEINSQLDQMLKA